MSRFRLCSLLLTAVCALCGRASAQHPNTAPDALILVQPGDAKVILSVIFPTTVAAQTVRDRIVRLANAAGWKVASLQVKVEEVKTNPQFGQPKSLGKQTGALAVLTHAPQMREGGFWLQPYVNAFADLHRIELFYLAPPVPAFQGLREYESAPLVVKLVQDGGPYRYLIEIRDHSGALPTLPIRQSRPTKAQAAKIPETARPNATAFAPVVTIAAASGLLVLTVLLLRARVRTAHASRVSVRRTSRL